MTPEGKVKAQVRRILLAHKAYTYMPVQTKYSSRSVDFLVCAYGLFLSIETKRAGEDPTPEQNETIRDMKAAGAHVLVIDNYNINELGHWLMWSKTRQRGDTNGPYEYDPPELPITNLTGN